MFDLIQHHETFGRDGAVEMMPRDCLDVPVLVNGEMRSEL